MFGGGPPPTNGHWFPSHESLFEAIATHHLTSPPGAYPAYSNTGTGLLGVALEAAANNASGVGDGGLSYAELLQRDVFGPMGMNGSHLLTTEENKHLVVVPSVGPEVAVRLPLIPMRSTGI